MATRQLESTVTAEGRPSGVQILAKTGDDRPFPDVNQRRLARVPENTPAVGVRAPADDATVAEQDRDVPGPGALEA